MDTPNHNEILQHLKDIRATLNCMNTAMKDPTDADGSKPCNQLPSYRQEGATPVYPRTPSEHDLDISSASIEQLIPDLNPPALIDLNG